MNLNAGDTKFILRMNAVSRQKLEYASYRLTNGNRSELVRLMIERIYEDIRSEELEEVYLAA